MRWTEITEDGFRGGPVMPDDYDGSPQVRRATAAQCRTRRHRRHAGRQRPAVQHGVRAAAGHATRPPASRSTTRACRSALEEKVRSQETGTASTIHIDRLRQAGGRPDRQPDAGDDVLRDRGVDRRHRCIYAYTRCLRSTVLVLACSLVAVVWQLGIVRAARLRARPLFDPRAVPGVRHRRLARRAEDERHHAGRRPRHASLCGGALHVPAPVPRRPHRAAGRRGRLRGADDHRHSRDPRTGA